MVFSAIFCFPLPLVPSHQGRGELVVGQALLSQLSGELLSLGLGVRFRAPGTSMHPTIRHGDEITVERVEPGNLKRGDIILYRFTNGLIAHRIVNIEKRNNCGRTFILRGDAAVTDDAPVKPAQVLGKVVRGAGQAAAQIVFLRHVCQLHCRPRRPTLGHLPPRGGG